MSGDTKSIRLRGQKVEDLPHAQRMEVLKQIQENDRATLLGGILKRYPKYDVIQLQAAIRQMEENVRRMQSVQVEEHSKIREYRNLISKCEERDRELASNGF